MEILEMTKNGLFVNIEKLEEHINILQDKVFNGEMDVVAAIYEIYTYSAYVSACMNYKDYMEMGHKYETAFKKQLLLLKAEWRDKQINSILE